MNCSSSCAHLLFSIAESCGLNELIHFSGQIHTVNKQNASIIHGIGLLCSVVHCFHSNQAKCCRTQARCTVHFISTMPTAPHIGAVDGPMKSSLNKLLHSSDRTDRRRMHSRAHVCLDVRYTGVGETLSQRFDLVGLYNVRSFIGATLDDNLRGPNGEALAAGIDAPIQELRETKVLALLLVVFHLDRAEVDRTVEGS